MNVRFRATTDADLPFVLRAEGETEFVRHWTADEHNARARHLYRSVGFVPEGMMRERIRVGDRFRGLVLMAILEDEYRASPRTRQRT